MGPFLLAAALVVGCQRTPPPQAAVDPPAASGDLVLLHTNDLHCHYEPTAAPWLEGRRAIGGFAALDSYLRTVRAQEGEDRLLVLDAGDLLSGTPLSELEHEGVRGGEMTAFVQEWGFDAWALGNHEFDQGIDNLEALVAGSAVPVLCANLEPVPGTGPMQGLEPAIIFERAGLRVGVIGVISGELERFVPSSSMQRLRLLDPVQAATQQAQALDPLTDLLVLLSHSGLEEDRVLAAQVPGIDLVIGGHSHDALLEPELVGQVYVVQAGSNARSVGRLDLRVEHDAIVELRGQLVDLEPQPTWQPASAQVLERLQRVGAAIDASHGAVVGSVGQELLRDSYRQSSLGQWVTAVLQDALGTDLAIYNSGGLRADLPAGPIKVAHLYSALPFGNHAVSFEMSGAELRRVVERNAFSEHTRDTSSLQCSGLDWSWRAAGSGQEILWITVGGEPVDPERGYTVAANSYMAQHMDEILGLSERPVENSGATVLELVQAAFGVDPLVPPPARSTRSR